MEVDVYIKVSDYKHKIENKEPPYDVDYWEKDELIPMCKYYKATISIDTSMKYKAIELRKQGGIND